MNNKFEYALPIFYSLGIVKFMAMDVTQQDDKKIITLGGIIDEDFDLKPVDVSVVTQVEINLRKVKMINSCGIRNWIHWTDAMSAVEVSVIDCPQAMFNVANMVDDFFPKNFTIQSFEVPYFCEECEEVSSYYFTPSTLNEISEEKKCVHCGAEAEVDVVLNQYLSRFK